METLSWRLGDLGVSQNPALTARLTLDYSHAEAAKPPRI